jgi:hypothetical protein
MSPSGFDDFARKIAAPMSRRQTLRVAAGLMLAAFLPARPGIASAGEQDCEGRNELCPTPGSFNCGHSTPGQTGACCCYCCASGDECHCEGGRCFCCANKCGDKCCNKDEQCVDGECVTCPSDRLCGSVCCEHGKVCRNAATGLCCVESWHACTAGFAGAVKCCPPRDECCFDHKTKTAKCCNPDTHRCVSGKCECKKGITCGSHCCHPKTEHCDDGRCCPKGKVNCGKACCDKGKCCGEHCAAKGKHCCNGVVCDKPCCNDVCCKAGEICSGSGTSSLSVCKPNTRR